MPGITPHGDMKIVFVFGGYAAEVHKRCGKLIEWKGNVCRYIDGCLVVLEAPRLLAFKARLAVVPFIKSGNVHEPKPPEVAVEDIEG